MVFLLTAGCLLFTSSGVDGPEEEEVNFDTNFPTWKLVVAAYGIVAFQFDIHPVILTIQMDMKDKTKLSRALIGGFLGNFFCLISYIAYNLYAYSSVAFNVWQYRLNDSTSFRNQSQTQLTRNLTNFSTITFCSWPGSHSVVSDVSRQQ